MRGNNSFYAATDIFKVSILLLLLVVVNKAAFVCGLIDVSLLPLLFTTSIR